MTQHDDDTRVTPSSPDTAWLFERGEGNMPPGEGAAFANGYRRGQDEAAAEIERLRVALKECADDLEAMIAHHYDKTLDYPSQKIKYDRDMTPVVTARRLLNNEQRASDER